MRIEDIEGCKLETADRRTRIGKEEKEVIDLLPEKHTNMITKYSKVSFFHGFYKLYCFANIESEDVINWNRDDCWKKFWNLSLQKYFCFGATGVGDQYCYNIDELRNGSQNIYLLDAITMKCERLYDKFDRFLEHEVYQCSIKPFCHEISEAFERIGDIEFGEMVQRIPHIFISDEKAESFLRMPARMAVIYNADFFEQFKKSDDRSVLFQIEPYEDAGGNPRIRLIFSNES